jgi:hypothetical protein
MSLCESAEFGVSRERQGGPVEFDNIVDRLLRLEEIEAARDVTWRYARSVDEGDTRALAAVFAENARLISPSGDRRGREVIVDYYRQVLADPFIRRHLLANPRARWEEPGLVTITSDFAFVYLRGSSSTEVMDEGEAVVLGWGEYVDEVRVTDGVGEIAVKHMRRIGQGEVPWNSV